MSKEAMKLRAAAEKVVELCSERPLSLGKWFIDMSEACESLREALAEQPAQQEPVAWRELLREARDNCKASIVEEGISASRKEYRIDLEARLTAALNTSPQLAPAQRTWVGLTKEELQKIL